MTTTPTPPADTTRFYLKKMQVRPALQAVMELQKREDISGKFARKVGRVRRALTKADEEINQQRQDLVVAHAEKYPAGHEKAGQPTPVYATDPQGNPMFKKDEAGNDTDERVVVHDQYNVADPGAFSRDFKELLDEVIVVECPCFKTDEINGFKSVRGDIVDKIMDLEEGADTTIRPEGKTLELVRDGDGEGAGAEAEEPLEERTAP